LVLYFVILFDTKQNTVKLKICNVFMVICDIYVITNKRHAIIDMHVAPAIIQAIDA